MFSLSDATLLINRMLGEPHAGLLSGIVFGTKSTMSNELYNALVDTGTLHIAALSGANITILTNLTGKILVPLFSRRGSSLLTILFIIGFIIFVGPSPSVIRAAIMGSTTLLGIYFGKQIWAFWSWVIAVSIMIFFDPSNLLNISFQLSTGAALGLILFGEGKKPQFQVPINSNQQISDGKYILISRNGTYQLSKPNIFQKLFRAVGRLIKPIIKLIYPVIYQDLRTTLSAQVFTIPIILFSFHRISLISPVANLTIGWTIPIITMGGLITVITGLIFFPLGQLMAYVLWLFLDFLIRVVMLLSHVPFASLGY